jgi:diamine N-acetyltransferase
MNNEANIFLRGEFINLRPLRIEDAEITFNWRNSERAKLLNKGAATIDQQENWIASRPSSEFNFIIEIKNCLTPVGMISLTNIDNENLHGEPGRFLIGEEAMVSGIPAAVEAVKLLYEFAFDKLGLVRLFGIVADNNPLMIKWHKYMGMRIEGRLRDHLNQGGIFHDGILIGLLVDDYRKVTLLRAESLMALARVNLKQ